MAHHDETRPITSAESAPVWRIDARQHLLSALLDFARAAATIRRRLLISNCGQLEQAELEYLIAAGAGYAECVPHDCETARRDAREWRV